MSANASSRYAKNEIFGSLFRLAHIDSKFFIIYAVAIFPL